MMHDASRSHGVADNRNRVRLQIFQEFGRRTFNFRHNTEAWLSVNIHNLHVGNLLERLSYASRCPDKLIEVSFTDRKSTRLNSSHLGISYAVFCLKKKN